MKNKIKFRQPAYKPELIQIGSMKSNYPDFKQAKNRDGNLVFTGQVQAKVTMPVYTISVEFRGDYMPRVRVLDPVLVEKPKHYYHDAGCLCLYKPENFNWTATKSIATYIIPWAICWVYFYEVWKEKGVWYGPEAKHDHGVTKNSY